MNSENAKSQLYRDRFKGKNSGANICQAFLQYEIRFARKQYKKLFRFNV